MNYMLYYVLIFNVDFKIKLLIMFINMNNKHFGDNLYCITFFKNCCGNRKDSFNLDAVLCL